MAMMKTQRGFALLVAVIFMSVMLTFGLALGSLAYKQSVLSSTALEAQYAFYAADAGLECALYADQQQNLFAYPTSEPATAPAITCSGSGASYPATHPSGIVSYSLSQWEITERLSLDGGTRCADVTVYKPASSSNTTYLFSQGYDVSCTTVANPSGARFVSRGISAHY